MKCKFNLAWQGPCGQPTVKDGLCDKHITEKCSCGKQAVGQCDDAGSFVCGYPVCEDCHGTCHMHRKKYDIT